MVGSKIKKVLGFAFVAYAFCFCFCSNPASEGISEIYVLPNGKLKGGQFMSLAVGDTFSDPGVKTDFEVATEGHIDSNQSGYYTILYKLKGELGDFVTLRRYVGVYADDVLDDLPIKAFYRSYYGKVRSRASAAVVKWNKVKDAKGWYTISNIGGAGGSAEARYTYPIYVFNYEKGKMYIPLQENKLGGDIEIEGNVFDYDETRSSTPDAKDAVYYYGVRGSGYDTAKRYFKPA